MEQGQRRIGALQEFKIFTVQYFNILLSDKRNLAVELLFPVLAGVIEVAVAGDRMFLTYENTKSGCFVLVSAAIWGGLFNSIQTVVRERENIKRDYVAGIRLRCYTASRAVLQLILCALQSLIMTLSLVGIYMICGNDLPMHGLIIPPVLVEYYVTMLLLMYAADTMGLAISCFVRKTETANVLAPYILIVQLIFSGVLFDLEGATEWLSYFMISRWGMEGLGSTSDMNSIERLVVFENRELAAMLKDTFEDNMMFEATPEHLMKVWLILLVFIVFFILFGNIVLHRVSKDTR